MSIDLSVRNRVSFYGMCNVLNGTVHCSENTNPKGQIFHMGPTAAIPVVKRVPLSSGLPWIGGTVIECCLVFAQHCCLALTGWSVCTGVFLCSFAENDLSVTSS